MFSWLVAETTQAQLCPGSLGDPIVSIDFGQGANPGAPLTAASAGYQYVATDCPSDGSYTVRNNSTDCFGSSWHSLHADHTGNTQGYFMLVNASYQPSPFYVDTVRGLCEQTTYELSAWILNVLKPTACGGNGIKPNITFAVERINGSLVQSFTTGDLDATAIPQWNKHGFFFTTATGMTDLVLRITNNAPGGCGNDLALDDIQFRACGPMITGSINGNPGFSTSFCESNAGQFLLKANLSAGFSNPVFMWQYRPPGSGSWSDLPLANTDEYLAVFLSNAPPGLYQYRLAVAEMGNMSSARCRIYSTSFDILVNALPVPNASNDGPACAGRSVTIRAEGGGSYAWTGPGGFTSTSAMHSFNPVMPAQAGKYYVAVTSAAGCRRTDSTSLLVNPSPVAITSFNAATVCRNAPIQLQASGGISYQWFPSTGLSATGIPDPMASPSLSTLYSVEVSNAQNCRDTARVQVDVLPLPQVNAGADQVIFSGQQVQLSGTASAGDSYAWSPPIYMDDPLSLSPSVNPPADQIYTLTVQSSLGCGSVNDQVNVKVYKDIFVPSAFSPNNDGLNDLWRIAGAGALKSFRVQVFNRWGERVFASTDKSAAWDGMYKGLPVPAGVYVYYIELGDYKAPVKGLVTVIR